MLFIYQLIVSVLLLTSPIILLIRILKKKENIKSLKEKFSFNSKRRVNGKLIWFHGASVGEVLSIIPIIKHYEKDKSIKQILVTSSTLSSLKVIKKFNFKKTIHQFYPIDHFIFNNKFINYWKPSLGIFVDSEIWPMMFQNLKYKNIPIILLNARLTKKTFSRWIKIKSFAKSVFNKITVAYPQNKETNLYLKELNVRNIITIGNLKFSENSDENLNNISKKLKSELDKKKIWVASSTHKTEEIFCAKAHLKLKKKITNLLTIIIPRHVNRSEKIFDDLVKENLKVIRHSSKEKLKHDTDIYIVDAYGEVSKFYNISKITFVGGSIVKHGGQNPLEPARFGNHIINGPNIENFNEIYKFLKKN